MAIEENNFPKRTERFYEIPEEGLMPSDVQKEAEIAESRVRVRYDKGEQFAKPGTLPDAQALDILFHIIKGRNPNLVDPTMFLGIYEIEREAISMLAQLLNHDNYRDVFGWFTSGGTASIEQAAWAFRNKFFREAEENTIGIFDRAQRRAYIREEGFPGLVRRGLLDPAKPPVILAPVDTHFADKKVADIIGLGMSSIVYYGLTEDYTTDYKSLEETVNKLAHEGRKTIFAFANAGSVVTGRVEDVNEFADVLRNTGSDAPIIVDAAQQYMMLGLLSERYPQWDFRVESVDAIVADPHKTDASTYPAGVILFRNTGLAYDTETENGYLHLTDKTQFDMKKIMMQMPQLSTSRGVIGPVSTWAHLLLHGKKKLREKYTLMYNLTRCLADYIKESRYFALICEPQTGIVPFHVREFDDKKAQEVYNLFTVSKEEPAFYISCSDDMRVRTPEQKTRYDRLKLGNGGKKIDGYGGLYIQIMQHATSRLVDLLIDRMDRFGYEVSRKSHDTNSMLAV